MFWFLCYIIYVIVVGDFNIIVVNIRGLKEVIENVCFIDVIIVVIQEMWVVFVDYFCNNVQVKEIVL